MAVGKDDEGAAAGLEAAVERCLLRLRLAEELTTGMRRSFTAALKRAARDTLVYAAAIEIGTGGAVTARASAETARLAALSPDELASELGSETFAAWHLDRFVKPTVALVGGAIGPAAVPLVLHATHRIGAEEFALVLPRPGAGLICEGGLARWLAQLPGRLGDYLALTGARLGRADALALGFLTHAIPAAARADIHAGLADADPVDPLLDRLAVDPGPATPWPRQAIEHCFSAPSLAGIAARLRGVQGEARGWAERTLAEMGPSLESPAAAETAALLSSVRDLDLRAALRVEHGVLFRALSGLTEPSGGRAAPELPDLYEAPRLLADDREPPLNQPP